MTFTRMGSTGICPFVCILSFLAIDLTETFNFDVCSLHNVKDLEVTYGYLSVKCGSSYALEAVSLRPTIRFADADETKLYEVMMIDPDAPSAIAPACRSWLHLLISNVPGSALSSGVSTDSPNILTEYKPPTPPKGTNYHRYITMVFSHGKSLSTGQVFQRCGFDVDTFLTENMLSEIPDAVNMFKAKKP